MLVLPPERLADSYKLAGPLLPCLFYLNNNAYFIMQRDSGEQQKFWSQTARVQILVLPFTTHVT